LPFREMNCSCRTSSACTLLLGLGVSNRSTLQYLTPKHGGNVQERGIVTIASRSALSDDLEVRPLNHSRIRRQRSARPTWPIQVAKADSVSEVSGSHTKCVVSPKLVRGRMVITRSVLTLSCTLSCPGTEAELSISCHPATPEQPAIIHFSEQLNQE
jgi:hypothetical protein